MNKQEFDGLCALEKILKDNKKIFYTNFNGKYIKMLEDRHPPCVCWVESSEQEKNGEPFEVVKGLLNENLTFVEVIYSNLEKDIAKEINKNFNYITRDKVKGLMAWDIKPSKFDGEHWCVDADLFHRQLLGAFNHLYTRITPEDSEPTLIADIVGECRG